MKWAALLVVVVVAAACSDAANTQYLPIGSRCSHPTDCGTPPYDCAISGFPFGYCEKPCAIDGDCPIDSLCDTAAGHCRRVCANDTTCRVSEGYSCQPLGAKAVCQPNPAP